MKQVVEFLPRVRQEQYHEYWFPGDASKQGIIKPDIDCRISKTIKCYQTITIVRNL